MDQIRLVIVKLSESFSDIWEQVAADAEASGCEILEGHEETMPRGAAAVVLAAGGAELEVLDWLDKHDLRTGTPVFAVGTDVSRRIATQIVGRGARDYFALPEDLEILGNTLSSAVRFKRESVRRSVGSDQTSRSFAELIGESDAMREVLNRTSRVVEHADATVLVVGETGTGKELLASAIHDAGPRRAAPFVPVNCSALPEKLIESELFGHERGAFTDANAAKPGLFEMADGGTLLLDEIGTLPVELQAKLLRVLQDKQVRRVGGTKPRKVNLRIIAATNEELGSAIEAGTFREDLYYRLSVISLELPPLRRRGNDVLLIAEAVLAKLARQHDLPQPEMGSEFKSRLLSHNWPGNVRELKNAVERALLLSDPGDLDPKELAVEMIGQQKIEGVIPFPSGLDEMNEVAAREMLKLCAGNRSEAARRLAISRKRLRRLLDPTEAGSANAGLTEEMN